MLKTLSTWTRCLMAMFWLALPLSSLAGAQQQVCEDWKRQPIETFAASVETTIRHCLTHPDEDHALPRTEHEERKTVIVILSTYTALNTPVWRLNSWWQLVQAIRDEAALAAKNSALLHATSSDTQHAKKLRSAFWQTPTHKPKRPTRRSAQTFA